MNRLNLPIILHSCTQSSRSRGILNYFSNCSRYTYFIWQSLGVLSSCLFLLEVGLFGNIQFCVLAWLVKSPFTSSVAYNGIACSYYREALINSEWLIARSAIGYKSHYIMSRSRTPPLLDFYLGKQRASIMLLMGHNQTVDFLLTVCHVSCPLPGFQIWFIYIFSVLTLLSLHGVDFTRKKKRSVSMKGLSQSCTLNRLSYKTYNYAKSLLIVQLLWIYYNKLKRRACAFLRLGYFTKTNITNC